MNQDGSNGFVKYGGISPRFNQQGGENANSIESRELSTGEMVGIFTSRESVAGKLGIFDPRSFNSENFPFPFWKSAALPTTMVPAHLIAPG